jgi:hypothetical protein
VAFEALQLHCAPAQVVALGAIEHSGKRLVRPRERPGRNLRASADDTTSQRQRKQERREGSRAESEGPARRR